MLNELLDVSIRTMIGMLPEIINKNNESIRNEFSEVFDENQNRLIKDLYVPKGSCKAHLGEFINLKVDYLTVNNIDSLIYSLSNASHNSFLDRFTLDSSRLTEATKANYAHDAASIIYKIEDSGSVTTVKDLLDKLSSNSRNLGISSLLGSPRMSTQKEETLNESLYGASNLMISRAEVTKYQKFDLKAGLVYTYYYGDNITIDDKHTATIDGQVGDIKKIYFRNLGENPSYRILLSRKDRKYVELSKDELVRLSLICIDYTEEYGATWDIDSYSVRHPEDIKIIYK